MRLPLLPLLVLPLVLARPAAAGICWTGMDRGGRCSSVAALRVGRAECCAGASRAPAAWSPRDLDSGEIFFYKALSGGVPCVACAESCAGVSCGSGRRCVVRGGRARCVCAAACRRVGAVCGSDGRTYPSLCRLRRRACRRPAKHLVLDYPGPCQEGSCEGVRCGGDKRCVLDAELGAHCVRCGACGVAGTPVCAVDGRTYAGACALRRAACERGRALPLAYRGPCIGVLEQRLQEIEQEKLAKYVEIANVPNQHNEDVRCLVDNIALKLNQPKDDIKSARRLHGWKEQSANILVELKDEDVQENWITAAKSVKPTVSDVLTSEKNNIKVVYVREAMTKYHKQLFWNAKQELKVNLNFKYVWFKRGLVKARKEDGEKVSILRTMNDIHGLAITKQ